MTAILRAALFVALVATSIPAVAAGQKASTDSLLRRIDLLERRATNLEQRVLELEGALVGIQPSRDQPVPASSKGHDLANWRRLRRGMTMDAVRTLLGEPEKVIAMPSETVWYYPDGGHVTFDSDKVDGWWEPSQ